MPKKIPKPKKQTISKKFDTFMVDLLNGIGNVKTNHFTIIGGFILLLGIMLQNSLISRFVGQEISSILFINLENALLFSLQFIGVFFIGLLFPPIVIALFIGTLITQDPEYQKYIMWGGIVFGFLLLYFKGYRNFLKNHFNIFITIYLILFLIGSYTYYYKEILNKITNVEIITSKESFQGKLHFSNGDYYFVEKNGEKVILNSRDVRSIKILQTGKYQINICNNTNINFNEVMLHVGLNYLEIKPGECSGYKERDELYKLVPMTVYTTENDINNRYMIFPTDYVGEELFESGKYSIYVNELLKENMTVKYNGGIEFEIK
ncbi:MAG: hypothetical protein QM490_02725 [Candidatus Gracilibacteria bacterium]